jgi:hypothetical protein
MTPTQVVAELDKYIIGQVSSLGDAESSLGETLRALWVTLRARWVSVRARWVTLRAHWVTFSAGGKEGGGGSATQPLEALAATFADEGRGTSPLTQLSPVPRGTCGNSFKSKP